jgi:hypothetical protein
MPHAPKKGDDASIQSATTTHGVSQPRRVKESKHTVMKSSPVLHASLLSFHACARKQSVRFSMIRTARKGNVEYEVEKVVDEVDKVCYSCTQEQPART